MTRIIQPPKEEENEKSFALGYGWLDEQIIMDPADLGKSGQLRMDQRPAFLGMLGRIRTSIVKTVIEAQVDRFFREKWGVEYGKFMQICCEYNVKVVTLTHDRRDKAYLDPLSPRFYRLTLYWRDPAWGVDTLIFFRSGNPSLSWSKDEDNTVRSLWPSASKEGLLRVLPIRSWTGIRHRASRLEIRRTIGAGDDSGLPDAFCWQDLQVMALYNVREETLRMEEGAKLIDYTNTLPQIEEGQASDETGANLGTH